MRAYNNNDRPLLLSLQSAWTNNISTHYGHLFVLFIALRGYQEGSEYFGFEFRSLVPGKTPNLQRRPPQIPFCVKGKSDSKKASRVINPMESFKSELHFVLAAFVVVISLELSHIRRCCNAIDFTQYSCLGSEVVFLLLLFQTLCTAWNGVNLHDWHRKWLKTYVILRWCHSFMSKTTIVKSIATSRLCKLYKK